VFIKLLLSVCILVAAAGAIVGALGFRDITNEKKSSIYRGIFSFFMTVLLGLLVSGLIFKVLTW